MPIGYPWGATRLEGRLSLGPTTVAVFHFLIRSKDAPTISHPEQAADSLPGRFSSGCMVLVALGGLSKTATVHPDDSDRVEAHPHHTPRSHCSQAHNGWANQ